MPGEWFDDRRELVTFNQLPIDQQRRVENRPVPFSEGRLKTLDDEREVFDLVNFGGLKQGETDE